jgi:hypothetical protein
MPTNREWAAAFGVISVVWMLLAYLLDFSWARLLLSYGRDSLTLCLC